MPAAPPAKMPARIRNLKELPGKAAVIFPYGITDGTGKAADVFALPDLVQAVPAVSGK